MGKADDFLNRLEGYSNPDDLAHALGEYLRIFGRARNARSGNLGPPSGSSITKEDFIKQTEHELSVARLKVKAFISVLLPEEG